MQGAAARSLDATPPQLANAAALLTTLSDPNVLKVISWLLDREPGERSAISRCGEALGLDRASVVKAYGKLTAANLIVSNGPQIEVKLDLLRQAAQNLDETNPVVRRLEEFPHLKALFSHGRLTTIPVETKHSEALGLFLAGFFHDAVSYEESAVNDVLRQVHHDFAALRRMMVDLGIMNRDGNAVYTLSKKARMCSSDGTHG